jgi:hypothetical protein
VRWREHYLFSRVASSLVNVTGEKSSETSIAVLFGKTTFKAALTAGTGFFNVSGVNVTGTRVVPLLTGLESFLSQ